MVKGETHQSPSRQNPTVVFTVDENYALPLAVALYSLLSNLNGAEQINVYVIHPSHSEATLSEATKHRLRAVTKQAGPDTDLTFLQVHTEKYLGHLELDYYGRFTETIYFRLLMGKLLPERHKKVLYLDCDVIVEDNILDLWSIDMEGQVLLATHEKSVSCPKFGISRWEELGLDPDDPFFNSGVLLFDMEKWRAQNFGPRILRYLHRYRNSLNMKGNQEGFNAVLAGQWKPISQRWNVLHYYYDPSLFERFGRPPLSERKLSEITEDPGIIHLTGEPKPWQPGCEHPDKDRFCHYLRESGWFSYPEYVRWRMQLAAEAGLKGLKDLSRPYRDKIGL